MSYELLSLEHREASVCCVQGTGWKTPKQKVLWRPLLGVATSEDSVPFSCSRIKLPQQAQGIYQPLHCWKKALLVYIKVAAPPW